MQYLFSYLRRYCIHTTLQFPATSNYFTFTGGTRIPGLKKIVEDIVGMPVTLVATHVHSDHTGSAVNEWDEIWINAADEVNTRQNMRGYKGTKRYLTDGQVFDLGGRRIEVIFTPGHTPGNDVETPQRVSDIRAICEGVLDGTKTPVKGSNRGLPNMVEENGVKVNFSTPR